MKKSLAIVAAAGVAGAMPAMATIYTLEDGNSRAVVNDAGTLGGMTSWVVDGVENLTLQGFWFRTNTMSSERNIGTLPLVGFVHTDTNGISDPRADTLRLRYDGGGYFIETRWSLRGGTSGSFTSDIAETISIINTSNQPLIISFFQYSDFDLGGTVTDQSLSIGGPGSQVVSQSDLGFIANETVVTPGPTAYEVGFVPGLLNRLNDGAVDNLANAGGPIGPGDLSWAYQWDFVIPAGQSRIISKDKQIVPAPGAFALLGLGGAVLLSARGKRR
ncbi:MAG: hypothetical protein WAZ94_06830 [Phycisphaerales bacterium]